MAIGELFARHGGRLYPHFLGDRPKAASWWGLTGTSRRAFSLREGCCSSFFLQGVSSFAAHFGDQARRSKLQGLQKKCVDLNMLGGDLSWTFPHVSFADGRVLA